MKIKFFEYITIADIYGHRRTVHARLAGTPLAHSIAGHNYMPVDILGGFQEIEP
jgi:hypothetical protein